MKTKSTERIQQTLVGITLALLALAALAAPSQEKGVVSIDVKPSAGSAWNIKVSQTEDGSIKGQNSLKGNTVHLKVKNGQYRGLDNKGQLTNLSCRHDLCRGYIDGSSARLRKVADKEGRISWQGTMFGTPVKITRDDKTLKVMTDDLDMQAQAVSDGTFTGQGHYHTGSPGDFDINIQTRGTLRGLADNGLVEIFVAAPLVQGALFDRHRHSRHL